MTDGICFVGLDVHAHKTAAVDSRDALKLARLPTSSSRRVVPMRRRPARALSAGR